MMQFATKLPIVGTYAGNTTAQYLLKAPPNGKRTTTATSLCARRCSSCEELAMNVGVGPIAADFIKHTTGPTKAATIR